MHHWRIALLSRRHRDLIRNSHSLLLKLRQEYCVLEQWICIFTTGNNGWTAFDSRNNTWRNLAHADVGHNFLSSDKESMSAGTHLMWLGREVFDFACYKYDLVSNSWKRGPVMVNPRSLFASATCGKFAFVAGGFSAGDMQFNVLDSAERYDSSKGIWEPLPPMANPRHRCSGFFMDGKFYVIGGKTRNHEPLTSGEEFDPDRNMWRTIENMYCDLNASQVPNASPPLVAVAGNELYTIESTSNLLKVYEKQTMCIWEGREEFTLVSSVGAVEAKGKHRICAGESDCMVHSGLSIIPVGREEFTLVSSVGAVEAKGKHWICAGESDCMMHSGLSIIPVGLQPQQATDPSLEDDWFAHGICRAGERSDPSLEDDWFAHGICRAGERSTPLNCLKVSNSDFSVARQELPALKGTSSGDNNRTGNLWNSYSSKLSVLAEDKPWDSSSPTCGSQDNGFSLSSLSCSGESSSCSLEDASKVQSSYKGPLASMYSLEEALPCNF